MPRVTLARATRRPARGGFTLIELLVALLLLAVVGGTLGTLLVSQYRIFNRTRGATQMQRDLRTGLGLLPMDLRGASRAGGDITVLTDTAIYLRATIGSSIVCARPALNVVSLPPLNGTRAGLTQWHSQPLPGDIALVYDENVSTGPEDDRWLPYDIQAITTTTSTAAVDCHDAPFASAAADPPASKPRWRITLVGNPPLTVTPGMPVRFLRPTRYSLYRPGTDPDAWYLGYRELVQSVWTPIEPIAGPFEPPRGTRAGIQFTYFDTLGQRLAVPTGSLIGRIDLSFRTRNLLRGAGARDSLVLRDSVSVRVALRNRL
jgi:prepilin-type N-terminal cleavage/methylation domain-containing protein